MTNSQSLLRPKIKFRGIFQSIFKYQSPIRAVGFQNFNTLSALLSKNSFDLKLLSYLKPSVKLEHSTSVCASTWNEDFYSLPSNHPPIRIIALLVMGFFR